MEPANINPALNPQLENDGSFILKQFALWDVVSAVVLFLLFFGNCCIIKTRVIGAISYNYIVCYSLQVLTLLPAIVFSLRAMGKNARLTITSEGIYSNILFITSWQNFISVTHTQQSDGKSSVLIINYYKKPDKPGMVKISLAAGDSKSGGEVVDVIDYFHSQFKMKKT